MSDKKTILFSDVWNESESLFKDDKYLSVPSIIAELTAKLSVYKSIDKMENVSKEEKHKIKSNLFGNILASLTQLSLVDDINSFTALFEAVQNLKKEKLEI